MDYSFAAESASFTTPNSAAAPANIQARACSLRCSRRAMFEKHYIDSCELRPPNPAWRPQSDSPFLPSRPPVRRSCSLPARTSTSTSRRAPSPARTPGCVRRTLSCVDSGPGSGVRPPRRSRRAPVAPSAQTPATRPLAGPRRRGARFRMHPRLPGVGGWAPAQRLSGCLPARRPLLHRLRGGFALGP